MKIAIVLGNRMNDDGSLSKIMIKRLLLTLKFDKVYHPDLIITSGGIANELAGVAEGAKMKEWLIEHGIEEERIIAEVESHTTRENAMYSVPIALSYHPDTIIVITSSDHYEARNYSVVSIFNNAINDDTIDTIFYTNSKIE